MYYYMATVLYNNIVGCPNVKPAGQQNSIKNEGLPPSAVLIMIQDLWLSTQSREDTYLPLTEDDRLFILASVELGTPAWS